MKKREDTCRSFLLVNKIRVKSMYKLYMQCTVLRSISYLGCEIPHAQGKRNPSKTVGVAREHQRADTLKPYSLKPSQSNHTRTTALCNSMKLSHDCGATQDGQNNTLEGINSRITEAEEWRNDCHITKYRKKNEKKKKKKKKKKTTA